MLKKKQFKEEVLELYIKSFTQLFKVLYIRLLNKKI